MNATVAELAHSCALMTRARALAAWVGRGRPVNAKGVLRRTDVGEACAAVGLPDPGRVRSALDAHALHRVWIAAEGAGLIAIDSDLAVAGTPAQDPLAQWRAGVGAVLRAESADEHRIGAAVVCHAVLDVLGTGSMPDDSSLRLEIEEALDGLPERERSAGYSAFSRDRLAEDGARELLAECGAISHPAAEVTPLGRWAYDEFADPGAPAPSRGDGEILQLKIGLDRFRPPVWRRVLMPADMSLTDLHHVIQIAMDWDGDHLHVFTVDEIHYSDPAFELMDCGDEDGATLASALPRPRSSIRYRYDLGSCWDHTITLEKVLPHDPDQHYPACTAGRGSAPVEDSDPEDPLEPPPFRLDDVDKRLAALHHPAHRP